MKTSFDIATGTDTIRLIDRMVKTFKRSHDYISYRTNIPVSRVRKICECLKLQTKAGSDICDTDWLAICAFYVVLFNTRKSSRNSFVNTILVAHFGMKQTPTSIASSWKSYTSVYSVSTVIHCLEEKLVRCDSLADIQKICGEIQSSVDGGAVIYHRSSYFPCLQPKYMDYVTRVAIRYECVIGALLVFVSHLILLMIGASVWYRLATVMLVEISISHFLRCALVLAV